MKSAFLVLLFQLLSLALQAQSLVTVSSRYDDSFIEWLFYTDNEEDEGELRIRWRSREDNWTQWDYRMGEISGSIEMKWKDDPGEWELRGNNKIVTARIIWAGDFREWRVADGNNTLTLKTRWGNRWDEWELRGSNNGDFYMHTRWELDPRDWIIVDELDEKVPFETRLMLMFIVIFNSSPRQ